MVDNFTWYGFIKRIQSYNHCPPLLLLPQSGNLEVVVPPDILNSNDPNSASLEEGVANEGGNIQLMCQAIGVPLPNVQWRREGGKDIVVRTEGREKQGELV